MGLRLSLALAASLGVVLGDEAAAAASSVTNPDVSKLEFAETFQNGDVLGSGQWVASQKKRYTRQTTSQQNDPDLGPGFSSDLGIVLTEQMTHYGFGKNFLYPISLHKEFVLQYESKFDKGLTCGGAYLKLLRGEADISELDENSPYSIMFGPDKCGQTNKLHFILQYQNPKTNQWEEKHMTSASTPKVDKKTHLYTLHMRPDNSFVIYIDKERSAKGTLLENFQPPFNPPAIIDDPSDSKPASWVDMATIHDASAVKPDDWDDDAPTEIEDVNAVKPSEWLDDERQYIKDPKAKKPKDWDDEEDGHWEAPTITNPKCEIAPGCGKWSRPIIKNPEYKGKWQAPLIDNPAYIGEWKPKQIDNPNYYEDKDPSAHLAPVTGVAIEVWTTVSGIHYDNIIIADSLAKAFDFADQTWKLKHDFETEDEDAAAKEERAIEREKKREEGGLMNIIEVTAADALDWMGLNPVVSMVTAVVIFISILMFCTGGKSTKEDDLEQILREQMAKREVEAEEKKGEGKEAPIEEKAEGKVVEVVKEVVPEPKESVSSTETPTPAKEAVKPVADVVAEADRPTSPSSSAKVTSTDDATSTPPATASSSVSKSSEKKPAKKKKA